MNIKNLVSIGLHALAKNEYLEIVIQIGTILKKVFLPVF